MGVDSPVLWSAPEEGVLMGRGMQTKEGDAGGYTLKQGVLRSGREHRLLLGDLATPCPVYHPSSLGSVLVRSQQHS